MCASSDYTSHVHVLANATAGNRTRVETLGGFHHATRPRLLLPSGRLAQWKSARSAYGRSRVRTPQCPRLLRFCGQRCIRCRPVVRISGFHPEDPGSNPGGGADYFRAVQNVPPSDMCHSEKGWQETMTRVGFEPTPPKRLRP